MASGLSLLKFQCKALDVHYSNNISDQSKMFPLHSKVKGGKNRRTQMKLLN